MTFKLTTMQWKRTVFVAAFVTMIILQLMNAESNIFTLQPDEKFYKNITQEMIDKNNIFGVLIDHYETKTAPFFLLQIVLRANEGVVMTRAFNTALIFFITYLIYDLTKRKEAILTPVLFWHYNTLWLTNEIIELTLVMLSIKFAKSSGFLIGVATLFRPWALSFVVLMKRQQVKYVFAIGLLYVVVLFVNDSFMFYLNKILDYAVYSHNFTAGNEPPDYVAMLYLGLFLFMGYRKINFKNPSYFEYGLVAMLPLVTKLYAHYFITSVVLFYVSYLLLFKEVDDDIKKVRSENLGTVDS